MGQEERGQDCRILGWVLFTKMEGTVGRGFETENQRFGCRCVKFGLPG